MNQNITPMASTVAHRARIMWRLRLHSAFRSVLACAFIGAATIHGPDFLVRRVKFATFSYLTSVLILSDATLGDTFKGCWHAFCATAMVVPLATLIKAVAYTTPNDRVPVCIAALAAGVGAFLVALPDSTALMAKRIAFGQIVVLCTDAVVSVDGASPGYMHPLHVAASTAFGALASVLALMIPFPGHSCYKVGELCRVYSENVSERMHLYLNAFKSPNDRKKKELIREAKPIAETGYKLIQSIKTLQDSMKWERPMILYPKQNLLCPIDRLQRMELSMRGIEYSLSSSPAFPVQELAQEQVSNIIDTVPILLQQKIEQATYFSPSNSKTEPETNEKSIKKTLFLTLEPIVPKENPEWIFFFSSCLDMLLNNSENTLETTKKVQTDKEMNFRIIIRKVKSWFLKFKLEFAFKCSFSLGLAVLFGLIFDNDNGIWAGLTIAISFVTGKQAVFTVANTRAQGTAIGSAYGVICCFLFHNAEVRFLALLIWIIFASFLRHSKMYGQTGGASASIGAFLILGRKKYGVPDEFAIARLIEVFIGLSCFIMVELFLNPTRAATLANNHLHLTLSTLQDYVKQFYRIRKNQEISEFIELRKMQRNLEELVCELKKLVKDAEMEPNFWYLPFRSSCYNKLVGSLSNLANMLYFIAFNVEKLSELPKECNSEMKELQEFMNNELELFQEAVSSSLKYLEKANLIEQGECREMTDKKFRDLELGKLEISEKVNVLIIDEEEAECSTKENTEDEKYVRERMVRGMGALKFCINSMRKEINETQICIKEIVRWENNSCK